MACALKHRACSGRWFRREHPEKSIALVPCLVYRLGGDIRVTELPCGPCAGGSYPVMSVCCYVNNTVMKTQGGLANMSAVEGVEVGCRSCPLNHHFMKKQSLREGGQLGLKVHGMGKKESAEDSNMLRAACQHQLLPSIQPPLFSSTTTWGKSRRSVVWVFNPESLHLSFSLLRDLVYPSATMGKGEKAFFPVFSA